MNIISSMFENHFKNFGIFRGKLWTFLRSTILENIENISLKKFRIMFWKFGNFFPNMSKKIYVNFQKYFEKYYRNFWTLFRKTSKIIVENLENNFMKFCESYRKFSKIISKKFRRFRKILRTFLRSISKNFEKYFQKKF